MYVDESGDSGEFIKGESKNSPHYNLSALIISQEELFYTLDKLKKLRGVIKEKYGLSPRTEIHASELIRIDKIERYKKLCKRERLKVLELYTAQIPVIFDTAKVINICLDKTKQTSREIFKN